MAIAYDASSNQEANGTTETFAHTCTGSDRLLVVTVEYENNVSVTGVTYNSVSMTLGVSKVGSSTGNYPQSHMYYLVAPATGANNIVVSFSGTPNGRCFGNSYTGVDQTTPINATNSGEIINQASPTLTGTITSSIDNCWGVGGFSAIRQSNAVATWTERSAVDNYNTSCDTNAAITPAGTSSFTSSIPYAGTWAAWTTMSIRPVGAASGVTVTPAAQALTFSVPTYSVTTDTTVAGTTPEVTLNTVVPTVNLGVTHTATEQVLTLSIPTYDVLAGGNVSSTVNTQELTLSIPTYDVSISNDVAVAEQGLVLSPIQPTIEVTADALQLVNTLTLTLEAQSVKVGGVWGRVGRNSTGSWTRSARNSN